MTLEFSLTRDTPETAATDAIVVGLYQDKTLGTAATRIDERCGGAIARLAQSGDARGKLGCSTVLFGLDGVVSARVVVVGLGERG
jgi:leucyl aminopeptidase